MALEYCTRDRAVQLQKKPCLGGSIQKLLHHFAEKKYWVYFGRCTMNFARSLGRGEGGRLKCRKEKTCFILHLKRHAYTHIHRYVPRCMCVYIYGCACEQVHLHKCTCSTHNHEKYAHKNPHSCIHIYGYMLLFQCFVFSLTLLGKTKGTSGTSLEKNVVNLA